MNRKIIQFLCKVLLKIPLFWNHRTIIFLYRMMGVHFLGKDAHISKDIDLYGNYSNLFLYQNAEITKNVFLLAKARITIGENSTLAYGARILTSANPNAPKNKLSKVYPPYTAPVTIENDVWVGANATLLPGITVHQCSVVAAGAVVTKDVPEYCVVAGIPAKMIKRLDCNLLK